MNLSKYKFVKIVFAWYNGDAISRRLSQDFIVGERGIAFRADIGAYISIRELIPSSSGVQFMDCKESQGSGSGQTSNSTLIPIYIYGIG